MRVIVVLAGRVVGQLTMGLMRPTQMMQMLAADDEVNDAPSVIIIVRLVHDKQCIW